MNEPKPFYEIRFSFVVIVILYVIALVATHVSPTVGIVAFICVTALMIATVLLPLWKWLIHRKKEGTE